MEESGLEPGRNSFEGLWKEDKMRLKSAAQKVSKKYKERRKALRGQRKKKSDDIAYSSGAFGVKKTPEFGKKRKQPVFGKKDKTDTGMKDIKDDSKAKEENNNGADKDSAEPKITFILDGIDQITLIRI